MDFLFNPAFWVSNIFLIIVTGVLTNVFGRMADWRELRANERVQDLIDSVEGLEGGAEIARRWTRGYDNTPRRLRPWRARKIAEEARAFHSACGRDHGTSSPGRGHGESAEATTDRTAKIVVPVPREASNPGVNSVVALAEESKPVSSGVNSVVALAEETNPARRAATGFSRAAVEALASVMFIAAAVIAGGEEGRQLALQLRWDRPNFDEPYHLYREAVSNVGGAFTIRWDRIVSRTRRILRRRLPSLSPMIHALVDALVGSTILSTIATGVITAAPLVACFHFIHRGVALSLVVPAGVAANHGRERFRTWWRARQARRRRLRAASSESPPSGQGPTMGPPS